MVPTTHANFRCLDEGRRACGSAAAPTSRRTTCSARTSCTSTARWRTSCDRHAPIGDYERFKAWCDEYFFLPHRGETRGVGGIFFDYLGAKGEHPAEDDLRLRAATSARVPRRVRADRRSAGSDEPYGETERTWQLRRRGRYVEFNLIYDRGTLFGLKTNGRIESILMSLPPLVRWDYDVMPQPGSPEAELLAHLRPTDWLGRAR